MRTINCIIFENNIDLLFIHLKHLDSIIDSYIIINNTQIDLNKLFKTKPYFYQFTHKTTIITGSSPNIIWQLITTTYNNHDDNIIFTNNNIILCKKTITNFINQTIVQEYDLELNEYVYNLHLYYPATTIIKTSHITKGNNLVTYSDFTTFVNKFKQTINAGSILCLFNSPDVIANDYSIDIDNVITNMAQGIDIRNNNKLTYTHITNNSQYAMYLRHVNENDLTKYGIKYGVDAAYWHLYTDAYYKHLNKYRYDPINILFCGINVNNFVLMLLEFFTCAHIYAYDINTNNYLQTFDKRIHSCSSMTDFDKVVFDVIFESRSHQIEEQLNLFSMLFPLLKSEGYYFCNSIHTSLSYKPINNSTLNVFKDFMENNIFSSALLNCDVNMYLTNNIENICVHSRNVKPLLCYRCKKHRINNIDVCECGVPFTITDDDSLLGIIVKK